MKKLRTIDLFCGLGGIRLGFRAAGFKTVYANDFDKFAKKTYDSNFITAKMDMRDIRQVESAEIPDFDFLLGGFPCQAFSIAGYRHGFEDPKGRGNLFDEIARILKDKQPTGFLLENVKNLKGHDGGRTFKVIMDTLDDLGYDVLPEILNTMDYGNVPQNRERIYIVGFLKNTGIMKNFKFPDKVPLTRNIINDILDKAETVPDKYYYNDKPLYQRLKDYPFEVNKVYQWRRQYVRENKKGVSPTLTANMGMGGHNVPIVKDSRGIRKLTPRECARLQGYKDDYILPDLTDSHLYKQIGNSVSVPVIERVASQMRDAIIATVEKNVPVRKVVYTPTPA